MLNSRDYWINRYKANISASGVGSYGVYANYKAQIINTFIIENNIKNMCELGCGDGNQLSLFIPITYYGYDISSEVVEYNKKRFNDKKHFFSTDFKEFNLAFFDLTLSLDVIFHLIEDEVYYEYMKNLFELSDKFVIIYSPNENRNVNIHVKYRMFSNEVPANFKLLKKIDNPLKGNNTQSDFFIYIKE